MGLLNSPFQYDDSFLEGTVTNVDPKRFVCTVRTVKGQYLQEVPWIMPTGGSGRAGFHFTPSVGDQVIISTVLTYPVIFGTLPKIGIPSTTLNNITGSTVNTDPGNNTNLKNGYVANPEKPDDLMPGDMALTSEGGAMIVALSNGSVMIKASLLAQIFLSKYDELVRIVARNWERFSDVGQQTVANVKGRMYEFLGWDRDLNRSKNELYELRDVIGDVVAGELLQSGPTPDFDLPPRDDRVRKYWLTDTAGNDLMVDILQENGKLTVTVQDIPKTTKTVRQQDKDLHDVKVQNPSAYSQITIVPGSIKLDHNNESITVMDSAGIRSDFGGHFVHIDASGVHMG